MNKSSIRNCEELPVLDEVESLSWGLDYDSLSEDLFARPYQGALQLPGGDIFIYRNDDLAALRAHPLCTHQTLSALTHGLTLPASDADHGIEHMLGVNTFSWRPPEHKPGKSLITRLMTPKTLAPLADEFNKSLTSIIDSALDHRDIDFVTDFARPAVASFWESALGYTSEESYRLFELGQQFQLVLRVRPTSDQVALINDAADQFMTLSCSVLTRSARSGSFPWLTQLLTEAEQMPIVGRPRDPISHLASPLIDGFHTLISMLNSVVTALIDAHIQLSRIDRDVPSFATTAFQEGSRLHPAIAALPRQASHDFVFGDLHIPKDTNIFMGWLFGNRDPEVFDSPNSYSLDRTNRIRQFTFGGGPYVCAGRNLVQVLSEWMLAELAERDINLERTDVAIWDSGSWLHELTTLPVSITAD